MLFRVLSRSIQELKENRIEADLAQSVERKTLNLVVVGSSPTVGVFLVVEVILILFIVWFQLTMNLSEKYYIS